MSSFRHGFDQSQQTHPHGDDAQPARAGPMQLLVVMPGSGSVVMVMVIPAVRRGEV